MRVAKLAPLIVLCACVAAVDTGPGDGMPEAHPTDDDAVAATAPGLVTDDGSVGAPSTCEGPEPDAPVDEDAARSFFMEGLRAFENGDYEVALGAFCNAYHAAPLPGLVFNIAVTCERIGLYREAADYFDAFADAEEESGHASMTPEVRERARRLRERARD